MSWEYRVFPLQYQDFLHLKSYFPHLKSNFPCTKSDLPNQLSTFFNGFPLSSTAFWLSSMAFCFLQRHSKFLQRLSDFPQRLSAFREIQENLFMARSIQKIAIRASYFLPLAPWASWLPLNNTYVSPNKYRTFLLVICKKFTTQNGPLLSTLMQQALLKNASEESCRWQAHLNFHVSRFLSGQKLTKIQFF